MWHETVVVYFKVPVLSQNYLEAETKTVKNLRIPRLWSAILIRTSQIRSGIVNH
jgi:hypothetical protein